MQRVTSADHASLLQACKSTGTFRFNLEDPKRTCESLEPFDPSVVSHYWARTLQAAITVDPFAQVT